MKNEPRTRLRRRLPRPTTGTVLGSIAVVLSLSGTAYAAGIIPGSQIVDDTITNQQIANDNLDASSLAYDSVGYDELAPGAVGASSQIRVDTIIGPHLIGGTITSRELGRGSVNSAVVGDESLTGGDIANGTVTGADIGDGQVASADVVDGSLTGLDIADNQIGSADVTNGSLTGLDIADNQIGSADVTNGSLSSVDLAAGTAAANLGASNAPRGVTMRGYIMATGLALHDNNDRVHRVHSSASVTFPAALATPPLRHLILPGQPLPDGCSGSVTDPRAAAGHLCVFIDLQDFVTGEIVNSLGSNPSIGRFGFGVVARSTYGQARFSGTWAVTAP